MARRVGVALVQLAVAGFAVVGALSFLPVWPCSLLEHFRIQYVLGGLVVAGAAGAVVRRGWLDAALIAELVQLLVLAPDLASRAREVPEGTALRVLLLNVHTSSRSFEDVRALIRDERPDLVALLETSQPWLDEVAPALAAYPSRLERARDDNFGIALYAKAPMTGAIEALGSDLPTIVAQLGGVAVIVTHPLPPMDARLLAQQERQFAAIVDRAAGLPRPLIVMGDFNATPWSRAFHQLRGGTGTCDTRAGRGVQTSFPAGGWLLRIPIDHVLVSCELGVRDRRIGRDVGSDHLPVIADLVIP